MKILWTSNSPMVASGYGKQTRLFTQQMVADGHEVLVFANFGHFGGTLEWQGLRILPSSLDQYGRDALVKHTETHKPDVHVLLFDIWTFDNDALEQCGITAYAPVDHNPMPDGVEEKLQHTPYQWAMSRFAEREMKRVGLKPHYVPHVVDTTVFKPVDRASVRNMLNIDDDTFFVVMGPAAHKGWPSRKSFSQVLCAWGQFVKKYPNSVLHIHTDPTGTTYNSNVDLEGVARFYKVPTKALRFPDEYRLRTGFFGDDRINALFNAADVMLLPSMGEGFGVPVIEAQAAGCPVIVSDFSAQSELTADGYKIPIYDDDMVFTLNASHMCSPRVSEIVKALEWAHEQRGNDDLRKKSRYWSLQYDVKQVWELHGRIALRAIYEQEQERRKERQWSKLGMWIDKRVWFPSADPAEHWGMRRDNGTQIVMPHVFPNEVDGVTLDITDNSDGGGVAKVIMKEIEDTYRLPDMDFSDGGMVLDIGAQVGVVSCYLAKKWPKLKVLAFEPMPENFKHLVRNIKVNGVADRVFPTNKAVTGDGRKVRISGDLNGNSGGNGMFVNGSTSHEVDSVTLEHIMKAYVPDRVALLKIDCEGAEYEILHASEAYLGRVDAVVGEFHMNNVLLAKGYDIKALTELVEKHVGKVNINPCRIDNMVEPVGA